MQLLPHSLTAVRVFNAAARHLSCVRAAEELFLTQSSVSKHLQSLEENLGVKLFTRVHRGLMLTEAGSTYWEAIKPVLSMLEDAGEKARMIDPDQTTIYLGVPPTFGEKWLMRRITDFTQRHPDVEVQFARRPGAISDRTAFTAEIRGGRGGWEGMHTHYLMGQEFFPVCSPRFAASIKQKTPSKLLNVRLLEHVQLPQIWERWLSAHRVLGHERKKTQQYEQFSVMISALLENLGVALLPLCLIQKELQEGALTILFKDGLKTEHGYYLVYPREKYPSAALRQFSDWLLEKCNE